MARANRHYIPGCVWHITHRCHKQEFLLRFAKDRSRYLHWLFEAKKRFGLKILDYIVTSNHVHLLVLDSGRNVIPQSIQLIAGRTAQGVIGIYMAPIWDAGMWNMEHGSHLFWEGLWGEEKNVVNKDQEAVCH